MAEGKITWEEAQEVIDSFILKVAENNKVWSVYATRTGPGYTSGQNITIGGMHKDGTDATNPATYMVLQASHRLQLHNPPLTLRVHAQSCQLFVILWTGACKSPQSKRFSRQEYWNGLLFPSPGDLSKTRDQTHFPCIGKWILHH